VLSNIETLIYIVNQGCITPHIWLSRVEHLHTPDRIVFDLDPAPDTKFFRMRAVAIHLKKILEDHSLKPFLMTTGSRGLHIIVPICPEHTFDVVRQYALSLAELLVKEYPHEVTTQVHKQKREDNIFIDILRNGFGATAVMPFAIRPLPGAPIATPIFWHELMKVTPQKYTLKNIFRRLGRVNNPWEKMESSAELLKLKR
jgi:bifunctional non-homologous end joining protein LigD